ncbi:peptide ABC transporter substrate-binding protein [Opitutus sp. GAS368]|uniref:peptide ABC transporter substrate-binding protein n=1 Tax=Opitutus sp. GAS368 TaxID=1882749 RepID=UPI00087A2D48|nr:peptide ABC transporter substrate-binding protein [Opitutus sp. GAS368]SDS22893.1 oligopeptide transport system substrate-binding protein [Opitutus sp. GAS368]
MRRPAFICLLFSVLCLLITGCAKRETLVERGNREGIFHISVGSEPSDLDPHTVTGLGEAKLVQALFDPLVSFEPGTLAPVPALAASWDISPDGMTYTFHLRVDAKWSDGSPLTAQDCVESWKRILTPTLAADYAYFLYLIRGAEAFHQGKTTDFSTVAAVARDPHTLVVTLTHPAPYFLQALLNSCWRPVNVRAIAAVGDPYRRGTPWTRPGKLVSSGAFVLKEWTTQQRVVVEKSPTYYDRDRVRLNAIHFYPTDSIDAEERAFRSGQLHATYSLPLSKIQPAQRDHNPALRIDLNMETYFFRLNVRKAPLGDARVRRALALAVDRDTIANKILPGGRLPAPTFVPPLLKGYTPPAGQRYDPAAARQLLAEAGHANGVGLPPIEILYNNSEILRLVAEAIQQMWHRDLGIDVRLVNQEYKSVFASRRNGDYQVLLGSWTADYLDATTFLDLWRSDSGNNHTGWSDPTYDALSNRANTMADPVARAAVLAEAEALVLDAAPIIPIYFNTHVYFLSPAVKGWQPTPTDHSDFRYVWLEAGK